jgi:hypothetical protein
MATEVSTASFSVASTTTFASLSNGVAVETTAFSTGSAR